MNSLPDDPYLALGLSKDATAADIRKVYLKLVVKSHPDKFQDPVEKAKKADEFHRIQQAYELLSDDNKRAKYHEELKLAELRREMGKTTIRTTGGVGASTTTTFSYDIHNAEPRPTTFTSRGRDPSYGIPTRSFEDIDVEIPRRSAKKPLSGEKSRLGARDDDRRRRVDDDRERERDRERREKESQKSNRSDRKKTRDKEIKRGSEDKFKSTRESYTGAVDSDEEYRRPSRSDRRSPRSTSRYVDDEYNRPTVPGTETQRKMSAHVASAVQYTDQVRRKDTMDEPRAGILRATTYNEETLYRYVNPTNDATTPRRSSASTRPAARRTPEAKSRDSPRSSKDKKSYNPEPKIVSIPDPPRPPPLRTNRSDPLNFIGGRKEPSRSKTFASPKSRREVPIRGLNRSNTMPLGPHGAPMDDTSDSSESSDEDERVPQRRPNMPTRQTTTMYKIGQQGDSVHLTRRAPEDSDAGELRPRVANARPSLNRTGVSSYERAPPVRSQSQTQPFAPREASPEIYQSSKVPVRPKYFQQPPYGEQINVASYDFSGINMEKSYQKATSRYPDEQRSRYTRGSVY